MQQINSFYPNQYPQNYPQQTQTPQQQNGGASAVSINIIGPQAYASNPNQQAASAPAMPNVPNYYSMYGANTNPALPFYPANYNNMIYNQNQQQNPFPNNAMNAIDAQSAPQAVSSSESDSQNIQSEETTTKETDETKEVEAKEAESKDDKKTDKNDPKKITPLTDEYVQSLENYLNNDNPKIRLIGAKDLMERFKEDDNRRDNPSLIPLLNKTLKDTSSAVRFLGLTTLQLGYSVGNDETVAILKEIQAQNKDKVGEDSLLASEILLKLSAPAQVELEQEAEK